MRAVVLQVCIVLHVVEEDVSAHQGNNIQAEVDSDCQDIPIWDLRQDIKSRSLMQAGTDPQAELCTRCRPGPECEENGFFRNFCLCKFGFWPEDDSDCAKGVCVGFEEHNDPAKAKCFRAFDREEYESTWHNDAGLAKVAEVSRRKGLIADNAPDDTWPQLCTMLDTKEGNQYLTESMQNDLHWPYLLMPGTFKTESWWSYCGLSSLIIALNYLDVPPPYYMGIFEWWSESKLLDLYPQMKEKIDGDPPGTTMEELKCMALDMGLKVTVGISNGGWLRKFWEPKLRSVLQSAMLPENFKDRILLVNYHRMLVGQPGSGHWSPVAAFAPTSDRVLIMDVARYKWPPHWVRADDLIRALDTADVVGEQTEARGWMLLEKGGKPRRPLCAMIKDPETKVTKVMPGEGLTEEEFQETMVTSRVQWW